MPLSTASTASKASRSFWIFESLKTQHYNCISAWIEYPLPTIIYRLIFSLTAVCDNWYWACNQLLYPGFESLISIHKYCLPFFEQLLSVYWAQMKLVLLITHFRYKLNVEVEIIHVLADMFVFHIQYKIKLF